MASVANAQQGKIHPPKDTPAKDTTAKARIEKPSVYLGLGFGLDYGGIGVKLEYLPIKYLGVFAGAGTNFVDLGYNAGLNIKFTPNENATFVLSCMYGYNGILIIKDGYTGEITSRKVYYGFTGGGGVEGSVGRHRHNKYSVMIFYPFRDEFKRDADKANATYLPLTISFGFSFGMD
jgi:hypothetical protein